MVRETIASETSILNGINTTQNFTDNSTQSNANGSKNVENITETEQTGSISGRGGNCTVC